MRTSFQMAKASESSMVVQMTMRMVVAHLSEKCDQRWRKARP